MGRGRKGSGVETREASIRISFTWRAERCRENLDLKPTPANLKHAARLVAEINREIALGTFVYGKHFPDSPRAAKRPAPTFGNLAKAWLKTCSHLAPATLDQYTNAVAVWERILGKDTLVSDLTYQVLAAKIGGERWASPKSHNNYLIPLRGIFEFEYHGPRAMQNPMLGIENRKQVKKLPDPLKPAERDLILADMRKHYHIGVWAYFAFAFYTGMRPEELIALRWQDIDWELRTARVCRVRTFRGSERDGSKTHAERDVDLVSEAIEALIAMKPLTFMKKGYIFENQVTGLPWHDERSQRDHYWNPTLLRLGIRGRRCYATRHTYATAALLANVPPGYIASQMGHVDPRITMEKYARWIPGADGGNARRLLEEASKLSQNCPEEDSTKS